MAWSNTTVNGVLRSAETVALPTSGTGYSSVIDNMKLKLSSKESKFVTFVCTPSAVSGTNLDVALYGSADRAGTTKYLLKDAIVADLTSTSAIAGTLDINQYPAPYYFIGFTVDVNESANTVLTEIYQ